MKKSVSFKMSFDLEPSLQNVVDQTSLRWIFVGGKGGVGKTTTSCSVAIQIAKARADENILLISTDPAHNLSDAFGQKFGKDARLVDGFKNLSCMEIDPTSSLQEWTDQAGAEGDQGPMKNIMSDVALSVPGIDEALSFAEVLKHIKNQKKASSTDSEKIDYSVIVFDTAPTGHTLRFLQLPTTLEKALSKFSELSGRFGPMLNSLVGGNQQNDMMAKLNELKENISEVNKQFQDPDLTTFICVCISEFLSLYETERMIQELMSYNIDVHCIVVNQLLFGEQSSCPLCKSRWKMQKKYLDQIADLYEDFHVVKMPLLGAEIRGQEALKSFSRFLIEPFDAEKDLSSIRSNLEC